MLQMAQAIAYQLSFIDGGVSSGLVGIAARLWSVTEIASVAQASLSALVAPLQNIASAWSGREQQLNNISRSLRQYGYVGQTVAEINRDITRSMPGATEAQRSAQFTEVYQRQFNDARQFSRGIVRQMSKDAALLPGELNDYLQTFSVALPQLAKVKGMTLQRATHLSNYLTAGAVAAGIDAPQASRDIVQALTGRSSIVDRSWTEVFSNYARFKGKRINTPAEFNRLTQEQRVQVLEDIAGQLQPMMDATGDAYEAIMGTFTSLQHELYLEASEPLFNAWKRTMIEVNRQLSAFYPVIAGIGRYFAQLGAGAIDKVTDTIMRAEKFMLGILPELQNFGARISNFVTGELFPILMRIYGPVRSAFGFVGTLLMGAARLVWSGASEYLWPAFEFIVDKAFLLGETLWSAGATAYDAINTAFSVFGNVGGQVANMFVVLEPTLAVWRLSLEVASMYLKDIFLPQILFLITNIGTVFGLFQSSIQYVQLGLTTFIEAWNGLAQSGSTLAQVFVFLAQTIREIPNAMFGGVGTAMGGIFDSLEGEARAQEGVVRKSTNAIPDWMLAIQKSISEIGKGGADLNRQGRGDRTNRPHAVQDFRYSRFDITQRFAEGFDPDRVASAFASDLEAMASQRLSSGFAPAFALP